MLRKLKERPVEQAAGEIQAGIWKGAVSKNLMDGKYVE